MKTEIKIKNKGNAKGTVGWLQKNVATIKVGETKSDDQGAWLYDKEGRLITVLAVRNFYGDGSIVRVERITNGFHDNCNLTCDIICSNAAWKTIVALTEIAVEEMEKSFEEGEALKFNITPA